MTYRLLNESEVQTTCFLTFNLKIITVLSELQKMQFYTWESLISLIKNKIIKILSYVEEKFRKTFAKPRNGFN